MQHLEKISRIGIREAGILDIRSGKVSGTGGSFFIDESLLSQISFIKEGEFSEVRGKPTLKLIGTLEPTSTTPVRSIKNRIIKTKGIRLADIVLAFLNQDPVSEPQEYINQICFETTSFLPVYYYMGISGLDQNQTIAILNNVVSRSPAKTRLIQRLSDKVTQQITPSYSTTAAAIKKKEYIDILQKREVDITLSGKDLEYCLQAIRILNPKDIETNSDYLCDILRTWFNQYYSSADGTLADNLRRSICWIDEALYMIKK